MGGPPKTAKSAKSGRGAGDEPDEHPLAQRGTWMDLPPESLSRYEPQDDFYARHGAYPLRGRPYGIAFVWSNVYQDSRGTSALQIAEDSAVRVAETLQTLGFEVRPRKNVRRKYIMSDLSDENLAILRDTYDIVLVYIAGCGDCKSFLTQYHEVITIQEVWDRFDAVGMAGKPRVLVMDLFSIRSTLMANFLEDLKDKEHAVANYQREMDAVELQGLEHPPSMLKRKEELDAILAHANARKSSFRHPPAASLPARLAVMTVPLASGVARWTLRIKSLAYPICIGVCRPEPLQAWYGAGVELYTGMHDFLGSCEHGWAFTQCGVPVHDAHAGVGKPHSGRLHHMRAGDVVTVSLDMTQVLT